MTVKDNSRVYVKINKVIIRNFKSIKELELELQSGIQVLVGPNGAGKSNILEAISFLRKTLVDEAGRIPYLPHFPMYWRPEDLIYTRDPEKEMVLGVDFTLFSHEYRVDIRYLVSYRVLKDTIMPIKHLIIYNNGETIIEETTDYVKIALHKDFYNEIYTLLIDKKIQTPIKEVIKFVKAFMDRMMIETIHGETYYTYRDTITHETPLISIEGVYNVVLLKRNKLIPIRIFLSKHSSPFLIVKLHHNPQNIEGIPLNKHILPTIFSIDTETLNTILRREIISRILLLKHPDIGSLREPKPVTHLMRLDERATNLAPLLLSLIGKYGGFPERISEGLKKLFPSLRISVRLEFGRAAIIGEEDGLELTPANLPDGAIKLLAILTAIELNPSILMIDEIENSMHVKMLEYIIDQLNSLDQPVLIATHSPVVVDLVGPERILIVLKDPVKGTVIERFKDPDKLSKRLKELGVALGDYVFYKKTYGD